MDFLDSAYNLQKQKIIKDDTQRFKATKQDDQISVIDKADLEGRLSLKK